MPVLSLSSLLLAAPLAAVEVAMLITTGSVARCRRREVSYTVVVIVASVVIVVVVSASVSSYRHRR